MRSLSVPLERLLLGARYVDFTIFLSFTRVQKARLITVISRAAGAAANPSRSRTTLAKTSHALLFAGLKSRSVPRERRPLVRRDAGDAASLLRELVRSG